MPQKEYFYDSLQAQAQALSLAITKALKAALDQKPASLLLPGGSSPHLLIKELAKSDLAWDRVQISVGDERCVPLNDEQSNAGQVKRLFEQSGASCQITPLWDHETNSIMLPDLPPTLCVLGMGADAHIASLFPKGRWEAQGESVIHTKAPFRPYERVSLSMSSILASEKIILLVNGPEKHTVYKHAKGSSTQDLPLEFLLKNHQGTLECHIMASA
ncbi:MAG: 6-phosphogluconolactonase [Cohaesibacter sp.]|jgi:6-phosphogluconolactonase|nr:6-phosphogluconolactonase [Cohaesibacter sp.]